MTDQNDLSEEWVQEVLDHMVPAMRDSGLVLNIVPERTTKTDVKYWVELGGSIMLDKPILVVAFHGRKIPPKLQAIADEIVELPNGVNPESSEELMAAIKRITDEQSE